MSEFTSGCEMIDVTSWHRPDTSWRQIDAAGHEHCWCVNGQPVSIYRPEAQHECPTVIWVKDGEEYWDDDDEPHEVGHLECRECGECIRPRYTADTVTQYIPGMRWFKIDGQTVTAEEWHSARLREWPGWRS